MQRAPYFFELNNSRLDLGAVALMLAVFLAALPAAASNGDGLEQRSAPALSTASDEALAKWLLPRPRPVMPAGARVSVSRSIFALVDDMDRAYFGRGDITDQLGVIDNMRAVFGRSHAAELDRLIELLHHDKPLPKQIRYF